MNEIGNRLKTKPNLVGCPKCGAPSGFVESEPRYNYKGYGSAFREWLEWSCTVCSYTVKTKVFIPEAKRERYRPSSQMNSAEDFQAVADEEKAYLHWRQKAQDDFDNFRDFDPTAVRLWNEGL